MHDPPRRAQAARRRMGRDLDQPIDALAWHGIAAEAPDIAPPQHEVAELRAKGRIERRFHVLCPSMAWKNVPLTEPLRAPASGTTAPVASRQSTNRSSPTLSTLA